MSTYLPEIDRIYLEDSFFTGILVQGQTFVVYLEAALCGDHPLYASPLPGEQHCYRRASLSFADFEILEWIPKAAKIIRDPDGSVDFGSIELHELALGVYELKTEWFEARLKSPGLFVEICAPGRTPKGL